MTLKLPSILCVVLLLAGCGQQKAQAEYHGGGGTIEAINHTKWAIEFSVNGQSGVDNIGPFQGGGGGCCFGVPPQWSPGMTVRVDWETSVAYASDVPEIPKPKRPNLDNMDAKSAHLKALKYDSELQKWEQRISVLKKRHTKNILVPDYTGQKTCGIVVHFLPCDQVEVTTSCARYGYPDYPINKPLRMKEPKVCPQQ